MFYLSNLQKMCLFACIDFGGVGDRQNHHPLSFQGYKFGKLPWYCLIAPSIYDHTNWERVESQKQSTHLGAGCVGMVLGRCSEALDGVALAYLSLFHHSC